MLSERITSEGLSHCSFPIRDGNEAAVTDPRRDVEIYIDLASRAGYRLAAVLGTHRNEDDVVGSVELAARTGAAIWHADRQWGYRYGQPAEERAELVGGQPAPARPWCTASSPRRSPVAR